MHLNFSNKCLDFKDKFISAGSGIDFVYSIKILKYKVICVIDSSFSRFRNSPYNANTVEINVI